MSEDDLIPMSGQEMANPRLSNPRPFFRALGKRLAWAYGLLLTVAAGGFLGANLAGFIPVIAEFITKPARAPRPESYLRWMHAGWLVGAGLFLAGGVLQARRRYSATPEAGPTDEDERRRNRRRERPSDGPSPLGIMGSAAVGGACGAFLGAMLGGTLLLLWFSLAYSPFSPASWGASISIERERNGPRLSGAAPYAPRHTTRNPVALYAFFGPIALGSTGGALFGGIGRAIGKASV